MESISNNSKQISNEESILTAVATNLPEVMIYRLITKGTDYRKFEYLSGSFQKIYGHTPEEGIADPSLVFESIFRSDIQILFDAEAESTRNLSTFKCEVRMINLDGTIRTSRFVSTPTAMDDGYICWDGLELDITDLKKIERDLQYNQFLLKSITEGSPDLIFAKDLNGNFLFANSAITKHLNKTPQEVVGKNNSLVFNREDVNKTTGKDLEVIKSGEIQTYEEQLTPFGKTATFITTKGPLKDAQGKTIGLFGIARDISERKKAEEALRVSQEKFEFAFNSSPNVILIQEEQTGKIIEVNNSITNVFGYSREEVLGKSPLELNLHKDPIHREILLKRLSEQGYLHNMDAIGKHKSGADLHLLVTIERHIIDDIPSLFTTIQDVTERKLAEDKVRKSQAQYKSIIAVSNTGAWEHYSDTGEMWFSSEYYKMLGIVKSEYETTDYANDFNRMLDLIHPDDKEASINSFKDYLNNGSAGVYEDYFRMKHSKGTWVWIWSRAQKVLDNEGNLTKLTVGTHIDISQIKQAELELQKLNLNKDRFISILGHDLKGPMHGILGLMELLHEDFSNMQREEIKEVIDLVFQSTKNASNLLEDVLLWAIAQSGKMEFNSVKINFKDNCLDVIELIQSSANAKNISIQLNSDDSLVVNADKNMLDTVLRNLISNAVKFTNKDGKIIISTKKNHKNTIISIIDNGIGINSKDINKIFDKSLLFTSIGTNAEKGTGFGLKLCHDFIEKHGGEIWVEGEEGKGTTFNFSLPDVS
jgi:PAS domain S-box-containing protein